LNRQLRYSDGIAKWQLKRFRRQLDPEWIELKPDESLRKCVRKITTGFFLGKLAMNHAKVE
jgi:hypothetical protein